MRFINIDSLIEDLSSEDLSVCITAVKTLGNYKDDRVVETLIKVLENNQEGVKLAAIESLGQIGNNRSVDELLKALKSSNEYIGAAAARALAKIGDARAVSSLIEALRTGSYLVKKDIALLLGDFKDERAVEPLIETFTYWHSDDEYNKIQMGAATSLTKLGTTAVIPLINVINDSKINNYTRYWIISTLGYIRDTRALPVLQQLEQSESLSDSESYGVFPLKSSVTQAIKNIKNKSKR